MFTYTLQNISLEKMPKICNSLSDAFSAGDVVALNGDLGAGKSTLARGIIQSLLGDIEVPSPTFTLVQTYIYKDFEIWHMDLYRLDEPEQIIELGIEDAFLQSFCLVEWAENAENYLPKDALHINITDCNDNNSRNIEFKGDGWKNKISVLDKFNG